MAAVNEWIVREYFETLGFLVSQPCKYQVGARHKRPDEEVDLLVVRLHGKHHRPPRQLLWSAADLGRVARAVVGVRGWHSERFGPALLSCTPDVCRFAREDSVAAFAERLGPGPVARILCLPDLPASRPLREKTLDLLRERGIDGVLSFRQMLLELAARVDPGTNYEKSDLLQILRILKSYGLLKDAQMELFPTRRTQPRRRKAAQEGKPS